MIIPGLCSVSFRALCVEQIIALSSGLKIPAIEWGGDIHVPHGDILQAKRVAELCQKNNISCPSYGSYYCAGVSEGEGLSFTSVLDSATALGTDTVRIWGGRKNYTQYSNAEFQAAVRDLRRIALMAGDKGKTVSLEYHDNTLTHTPRAVAALRKAIDLPMLCYYWQPPHGFDDLACVNSLMELDKSLTNLHVFHWQIADTGEKKRLSLEEGRMRWCKFFDAVRTGPDRYAFLEFLRNDDPELLAEEWGVLLSILNP